MPISDLPAVTEARIRAIFSELEAMEVLLDPDPLVYGPKRMNGKVAECRTLLSRCERIFMQVSQDLAFYKKKHRALNLDFELQKKDLFANDPEVRAGRNVADREALATMKLRDVREALIKMEIGIQDLEIVMTVVKAKRADLRDIQGRLKDQMRLCEQELSLGAHWGSRPPPGVGTPDLDAAPRTDKSALEQVQELLVASDEAGEVHLAEEDATWIEGASEEMDVGELLGGDDTEAEEVEEAEADDASPGDSEAEVVVKNLTDKPVSVASTDTVIEPEPVAPEPEPAPDETDIDAILAEVEAAENDTTPEPPNDELQVTDFPKVGYCPVCGLTSHETPSGFTCVNGHGGEMPLDEPPVLDEPKEEPLPEAAEEPSEPEEPSVDMDGLFSDDGEPQASKKALASVTTDEDVDDLFRRLEVDPAPSIKKKGDLPSTEVDDMDSLIEMFGA